MSFLISLLFLIPACTTDSELDIDLALSLASTTTEVGTPTPLTLADIYSSFHILSLLYYSLLEELSAAVLPSVFFVSHILALVFFLNFSLVVGLFSLSSTVAL